MPILRSRRLAAGRTALVVGIAVLALASGAATSGAAAQELAPPTTAMLNKALLLAANLPGSGFEGQSLPPAAGTGGFTPCPFIGEGAQPFEQADAAFTAGSIGIDTVTLVEALQQYSVRGAVAQVRQFAAIAAGACHDFTVDELGLHVHITLAGEAFPSFGNGTAALRMNATVINARNLTVESDIVAVRHGGTVMIIVNTSESESFNPTLTRMAVAHGYQKVAAQL